MYTASTFVLRTLSARNSQGEGGYVFPRVQQSSECPPQAMDGAVTHSAARAISDYCAKFHQPKALIVFCGGEPALAGQAWIRHAVEVFRSQMPVGCATTFAMQTNGVGWDDAWVDLCAELGITVSISLEHLPSAHGQQADASWDLSHCDAITAIEHIQRHPGMQNLFGGVVWEVRPGEDGRGIYRRFRSLGITALDFRLPVGANWDHPPLGFASPTPFADYLIPVFDEWWSENHPDVRIGYFDNLLRLLVGSRVQSDSLGADPLTTVEVDWDGSIEPVDSLRSCGNGFMPLGLHIQHHPIDRAFQQPIFQLALAGQEELCQTCRQCELRDICGGGYLPSRYRQSNGFDNPSIYCADLTKLIRHVVDACTVQLTATA